MQEFSANELEHMATNGLTQDQYLAMHQSNGITIGQMKIIAKMQREGVPFTMLKPNGINLLKDRHFIEDGLLDYEFPDHELDIYHVASEARLFDPLTGERLTKSMTQKYNKDSWKFMLAANAFRGQTVFILHNPEL